MKCPPRPTCFNTCSPAGGAVCPSPSLELAKQTSSDTGARHLALLHLHLPARELRTACPLSCWRTYLQLNPAETSNRTQPKQRDGSLGFPIYIQCHTLKIAIQRTLSWHIISLVDFPIHPQLSFQEPSNIWPLAATLSTYTSFRIHDHMLQSSSQVHTKKSNHKLK